jgi:hydrogenase expression/formation protein HypE
MSISKSPGRMRDTHISLAHGNGGRMMRELIEHLFAPALGNPSLDTQADAVALAPAEGELMITTDGFTVQPLEFPGGNIGSLAVHGTVNDLAVSGATPLYLTLNAFLEEGLEIALLQRLVNSIGEAARACAVAVVAGDTKVLGRGECDGVYLATTGVGVRKPGLRLGIDQIRVGDRILVSGPVGDHGAAVMLAREEFGMQGDLRSDAASVVPLARCLAQIEGLRFMRDPTRGGLATVLNEIARASHCTVHAREAAIPVRDPVHSVCELLGYDPLYLACEGRVVAVVAASAADAALQAMRNIAQESALIGELVEGPALVVLETAFGGRRVLDELEDDPLPRIC